MKAHSHTCKLIQETKETPNYSFKIVLTGESGVGKTCLVKKLKDNAFEINHTGTLVHLKIFDTAGQERYRSLIPKFYEKSSLAVIIRKSFNEVPYWVKNLKNHASPDCKIIIIGGKSDLEDERQVDYFEGEECQKQHGSECFMETSALTGENVLELFENISCILYDEYGKQPSQNSLDQNILNEIKLNKEDKKEDQKGKCCWS